MAMEHSDRFRIGTCGYSYPGEAPKGWYGVFYPVTARKRVDELEFYASYFNTVEINSTFYRPASPAMAQAWAKKTPRDFEFAVKVWQKFTHLTKLGEGAGGSGEPWGRFDSADVERFTKGIAPLAGAGKLGALLFQYPAGFRCDEKNRDRLVETLSAFDHTRKVVELRHRSWSDQWNETQTVLARSGAAWAYIDEPKFASSVKQELEAGGDLAYIRLHGRNHQKWWNHQETWERYDYFYQADQVRRLGNRLKQLAAKSSATKFYIFFNNHARGQAVANALMLKSELYPSHRGSGPRALMEAFSELRDFVGGDDSGEQNLS